MNDENLTHDEIIQRLLALSLKEMGKDTRETLIKSIERAKLVRESDIHYRGFSGLAIKELEQILK